MDNSTLTNAPVMLNDRTYLNYLTPQRAEQYEISRNVILVTAGAVVWDLATGAANDVKLAQLGFRFSLIPYFTAKIATLTFVILSVILQTFPLPNCKSFETGIMLCWVLASVSYCNLLNLRIRDRYRESFLVRLGFIFFLLVNFAFTVVSPLGRDFEHIPGTSQCIPVHLKEIAVVIVFVRLAFGFSVLAAISYHIVRTEERICRRREQLEGGGRGSGGGERGHSEVVAPAAFSDEESAPGSGGRGVPKGSPANDPGRPSKRMIKALMQGGQHYYLIMVMINFIAASFVFSSAPMLYQVMIMVPNLAISTSMACRAYRVVAMNTRCKLPARKMHTSTTLGPTTTTTTTTTATGTSTSTTASSDVGIEEGRMRTLGRAEGGSLRSQLQNCQPWVVKDDHEDNRSPSPARFLRKENTRSLQSLKQLQLPERERRYSLIQIRPRRLDSGTHSADLPGGATASGVGSESGAEEVRGSMRELKSGLSRQIEIVHQGPKQ